MRSFLALAALVALGPAAAAQTAPAGSQVFVVATLYGRHAATPAYGHDSLRSVIARIAPDVVVLDVSPRELREQTVHPSKAEYPKVIFPWVKEHAIPAYPGEPDEPRFTEIVTRLGDNLKAFRERHPEEAAADQAYADATFAALAHVWRTPADVNSALTDRMLASRRAVQDRLAGAEVAEAWRLWNDHAAAMVRLAVRENPGKRVLVLIGVENAGTLRRTLAEDDGLELVDVEAYLRSAD